jgi:tetratricopeptide (TPR) repeat protein
VLAAEGQWQKAGAALAGLPEAPTGTQLAVATAAWNGGADPLSCVVPEAADSPAAWRLRAWLAVHRGAWAEAAAALERVRATERTVDDRALWAWTWLQQGETGKALEGLAEIGRLAPQHPLAMEILAVAQLKSGDAQSARDQLAALVGRGGGGWSAWWNLGLAYLQLRDPQAALAAFDQGVLRCPSCAPLRKNRDVLRRHIGPTATQGVGP